MIMDEETLRKLKEKLLADIKRWQSSEETRFRDIVRNALDLDKKVLRDLMHDFKKKFSEVRGWGGKGELPNDIDRFLIVEKIRESLESDLGAATEV
jgi:molybdopterin converting factor small subunit